MGISLSKGGKVGFIVGAALAAIIAAKAAPTTMYNLTK